jgi:hypothetical protein
VWHDPITCKAPRNSDIARSNIGLAFDAYYVPGFQKTEKHHFAGFGCTLILGASVYYSSTASEWPVAERQRYD